MQENNPENSHDYSTKEIAKKSGPPLQQHHRPATAVFTSTKQAMNYVTIKGIESETSYLERDWALFCFKELMDNAYDFENDYYSNSPKQDRMIAATV